MSILSCCKKSFDSVSADYRFLTFRGPDAKHQKIDFVVKLCKTISSTYLVVREKNKRTEGYHFHAIVRVDKSPIPKSFFKKGCHVNLQLIGRKEAYVGMPQVHHSFTGKDIADMYECTDSKEEAQERHNAIIMEKAIKKHKKERKISDSVDRVLRYMSKELEMPCQFTDYVYVVSKKNVKLD